MITVNLNNLQLNDAQGENRPDIQTRATFPLASALGSENSALVYFELEPGKSLGRHTDSVEELLFILAGNVEVSVGDEQGRLSQGEIAVVPTMVPHNLRNVGQGTAKVLGFFGEADFVATFDVPFLPNHVTVFDTAKMFS
ncbi:MAG TPA: cupin domain-containing protein [Anaerolineae bacterium]|nr:cupin domain-containing protein [Anaerolineae bacterium]HMR66614.1 cupin domain-containing protein [Anaerolineae bacterium]